MREMRFHTLWLPLVLAGALAFTAGCAARTPPAAAPAPPAFASPVPPAVPRPPAPAPLLGHMTRAQVKAYTPWLPLFTQPYTPDPGAIADIKAHLNDVTVLLVMATWCPDSKRELPRFFAIMDGAGMGEETLTMVGVDRTKKDTEGLTETWGITRVPTFVFLRHEQEAGRVVEKTPAGSTLEREIARLLVPRL